MRKEVLAGALGTAVVLGGCNAEPQVRSGIVTEKKIFPQEIGCFGCQCIVEKIVMG